MPVPATPRVFPHTQWKNHGDQPVDWGKVVPPHAALQRKPCPPGTAARRVLQQDEASLTTRHRLSKERTGKAGHHIPPVLPRLGTPLPRVTPGTSPAASAERPHQAGHPPILRSFTPLANPLH